jgi:ribose transport system ATP-binding protein
MPRSLLHVSGLSKAYAAPVLKSIDFSMAPGEVVALTGENGAGKSTLSKIVAGLTRPDAGTLTLDGESFTPATRVQAERRGVRMVLQELNLIGPLSVAENLLLGHLPSRAGFIDFARLHRLAFDHLQLVGLSNLDPAKQVNGLGIGQQQLVEIARGLMGSVKLLILDEPTAMLTEPETARLFEVIASLTARGVGILYVSHRLDELRRISDRVVVLRDGQLVAGRPTTQFPHDEIVRAMVGRDSIYDLNRPRRIAGPQALRVQGLSGAGLVRDVSLEAHSGEVLGIAGLVGSGRTELLRLIFGAEQKDAGEIFVGGKTVPETIDSPPRAVACGIGMVPEDRKAQGLLLGQPLSINITLANVPSVSRHGFVDRAKETTIAEQWLRQLRIRASGTQQAVGELSGGNQQKALLARWVYRDSRVLLLDEPTRGVDIGARTDIYSELDVLASAGKALVVVSSDLQELMLICDRIAVMSAGRLVRVFERGQWSEQSLLSAAFSEYGGSSNVQQGVA